MCEIGRLARLRNSQHRLRRPSLGGVDKTHVVLRLEAV